MTVIHLPSMVDLGSGATPVDIWRRLHANLQLWHDLEKPHEKEFRASLAESDRRSLQALARFPASRRTNLRDEAGWTPLSCAALSWCEGAILDEVLARW